MPLEYNTPTWRLLIILVLSLVQAFLVFIIQPQEESSKPDEKPEKVMKIFSITPVVSRYYFGRWIFTLHSGIIITTSSPSPPSFSNKTLLKVACGVAGSFGAALLLVHVFTITQTTTFQSRHGATSAISFVLTGAGVHGSGIC